MLYLGVVASRAGIDKNDHLCSHFNLVHFHGARIGTQHYDFLIGEMVYYMLQAKMTNTDYV